MPTVKEAQDFSLFRRETSMISFSPVVDKSKEEDRYMQRAMYVNAALHKADLGKIDWDNRITMKLNENDLGMLLFGMAAMEKIASVHQANKESPIRVIEIQPHNKSFRLSVSEKKGDINKFVYVNLTTAEAMILKTIFTHSILQLTGRAPI